PVGGVSNRDLAGARDRVGYGHGADLRVLPGVAVVLGPEDLHGLAIRRVRGHRILPGVFRIGRRERIVGSVAGATGVELVRLRNNLCGPGRPLVSARSHAKARAGRSERRPAGDDRYHQQVRRGVDLSTLNVQPGTFISYTGPKVLARSSDATMRSPAFE